MSSSDPHKLHDPICICNRTFTKFSALNRHQRTCQICLRADKEATLVTRSEAVNQQHPATKRTLPVHLAGGISEPRTKRPSLMERIHGYPMQIIQIKGNASQPDDQRIQKNSGEGNYADTIGATGALEAESHHMDEISDAHIYVPESNVAMLNEDRAAVSDEPRRLRPRPLLCVVVKDVLPQPVRSDMAERIETVAARTMQKRVYWRTPVNQYGVYRVYFGPPAELCPVSSHSLRDTSASVGVQATPSDLAQALLPFTNMSQFLWMRWFLGNPQGGMSAQHSDHFTKDVVTNPLFDSRDLQGMRMGDVRDALVKWNPSPCEPHHGWKSLSVTINVPLGKPKKDKHHPLSAPFVVSNLQIRSIVEILRNILAHDSNVKDFIWIPYKEYQSDLVTGERLTRIYNEAMSGDEVHRLWKEVHGRGGVPGCTLQRLVLFLRLWSDGTHLVQFGDHKLWPFYLCLANQPKWQCADPYMGAWHDVAYFPQLPKSFVSFVKDSRGRGPSKDLIAHCNRELYHAAMEGILDDEFVDACVNGILIKFEDGVTRRVYCRILTHSADYKEKILLALIRDMGKFPCPRCFVPKSNLGWVGQRRDLDHRSAKRTSDITLEQNVKRARALIYKNGLAVRSAKVEAILKPTSAQPTENALAKRLKDIDFDVHRVLAVDLLHEVELGIWKAVVEHLVRILYALPDGAERVATLNSRYRSIPPFGSDTIRPISYDVSDFHKLAARDYEDLLQTALPTFDGLYPSEYQQGIDVMIYDIANFHSFSKLRFHTSSTLDDLRIYLKRVGESIRWFSNKVCGEIEAFETPKEADKRMRKAARSGGQTSREKLPKQFGLERYKLHALGDYVEHIQTFGTVDNYNTQMGESRHRSKKRQYEQRTSHHNYESQIAQDTLIQEKIRIIDMKVSETLGEASSNDHRRDHAMRNEQPVDANDKKVIMSKDESESQSFTAFVNLYPDDPDFLPLRRQILDYLFARLTKVPYSWDKPLFNDSDYNRIVVSKDKIYPHATIKINFTTYDIRREQDSLKSFLRILPKGKGIESNHSPRCFILLASEETEKDRGYHPFWYAQVLGIFHVNARLAGEARESTRRIDFLWVKWFGHCEEHKYGAPPRRLYKVGPMRGETVSTGVIDPEDVIRAAHLIPSFKDGRDDIAIWNPTIIEESKGDWEYYYVNKFCDRDMAMRHRGGGIGHVDPAQCARFRQLSSHISPRDAAAEVHPDSDECCSLMEEEDKQSSDEVGESDDLQNFTSGEEYAGSQSELDSESDD